MDFSVIKANLEKKGYAVSAFETAAEAAEYMAEKIKNTTVGIGGSMTAKQMNLFEILSAENDVNCTGS